MKTCYMVSVIGNTRAVLASCFANTREQAESACAALFVDAFGQNGEATAFDEGATPGIWIEGSPEYVRSVLA
jgi:hypothetical protein